MFYGLKTKEQNTTLNKALKTLVELFPRYFTGDMLITFGRCMGFTEDQTFMQAYRKHALSAQEKSLIWRLHTHAWAAKQCSYLTGDFVECGVYKGFGSAVVTDYLDFANQYPDKTYFLYDTFEGIPEAYRAGSPVREGGYAVDGLYESVKKRFAHHHNVRVIKGIVPEVFSPENTPEKIAFMHLDMNSAKAEIGALEHLFDRVVIGGSILFDDYGWQSYRTQKQVEDVFMAKREHQILELPTGQGLLIKHL